jgi:hypothetical protein
MGVRNIAKPVDVGSWESKYAVTTGAADLIVFPLKQGTVEVVYAVYTGSGAITLTNYKGLPAGSIVVDPQAYKIHFKVAASGTDTWKSSAAAT